MTMEQIAGVLGYKESYVKTHWRRIVNVNEKQGIKLFKVGRGDEAIYGIQYPWDQAPAWSLDDVDFPDDI